MMTITITQYETNKQTKDKWDSYQSKPQYVTDNCDRIGTTVYWASSMCQCIT